MNEYVPALLRVDDAQLTHFGPIVPRHVKQSAIANLPAHLRVERRAIENDIHLVCFLAWQNGFDERLCFQKIISEKFGRLDSELVFFKADFVLFLRRTPALALFVHQSFELGNVDNKSSFPSHELCEIERKSIRVV